VSFDGGTPLFKLTQFGACKGDHLGVFVGFQQFFCFFYTAVKRLELTVPGDDFFQLAVLPCYLGVPNLIRQQLVIAQLPRQFFVLFFD
jgi:hypothetical protein